MHAMPALRAFLSSTPWPEFLGAVVVTALLVAGCDTSVQTFVPRDGRHFSIFGALDVAADTQYIRVEPLADSMQVGSPAEIDATVTLEHLGSGQIITLRDSFMEVHAGDFVHNFWTTAPIEPGARYRLRVRRSDGATSQATTTLPTAPPEIAHSNTFLLPCADASAQNTFTVTIRGVDNRHLAALWVIYTIPDERTNGIRRARFDHFNGASYQGNYYEAFINYQADLEETPFVGDIMTPCTNPAPLRAQVVAAAGSPNWPNFGNASLDEIARPDTFSNVQNGHGLLVGVYSDTITVPTRPRPEE